MNHVADIPAAPATHSNGNGNHAELTDLEKFCKDSSLGEKHFVKHLPDLTRKIGVHQALVVQIVQNAMLNWGGQMFIVTYPDGRKKEQKFVRIAEKGPKSWDESLGLPISTVRRAIDSLVQQGLLIKTKLPSKRSKNGKNMPCWYTLDHDKLYALTHSEQKKTRKSNGNFELRNQKRRAEKAAKGNQK